MSNIIIVYQNVVFEKIKNIVIIMFKWIEVMVIILDFYDKLLNQLN